MVLLPPLLTTSSWPSLQNSRNLGRTLLRPPWAIFEGEEKEVVLCLLLAARTVHFRLVMQAILGACAMGGGPDVLSNANGVTTCLKAPPACTNYYAVRPLQLSVVLLPLSLF